MFKLLKWMYSALFAGKQAKLLILGLDNAGKTTLLNLLRNNKLTLSIPTTQPYANTVSIGGVTFSACDMGGHKSARRLWSDYCVGTDCIIFVVDAADRERIDEASKELNHLLTASYIVDVPLLVLGNKVDVGYACSEAELRNRLGLELHSSSLHLLMCSIVKRWNINGAMEWICSRV
jgi:GTP-binding protein SAR1